MSKNIHVNARTQRLCGHAGIFSFSVGKSARAEDARYATHTLCTECSAAIRAFAAPGKTGFYKLALPEMTGTLRSKTFANSIRIKAIRSLGPVMAQLANDESLYGRLALAAYTMLFQIDYAPFWIQSSEFQFDGFWLVSEVENLLRRTPCSAVKISTRSAFGYWLQVNRSMIATASAAMDEQPPSIDIAAQAATEPMVMAAATY